MPSNSASASASASRFYDDPSNSMATSNGYGRDASSYDHRTSSPQSVTISQEEYQTLRQSFDEYNALRSTLLAGGVTTENLQILINTGLQQQSAQQEQNGNSAVEREPFTVLQPPSEDSAHSNFLTSPARVNVRLAKDPEETHVPNGRHSHSHGNGFGANVSPTIAPKSESTNENTNGGHYNHMQDGNKARRTLFFTNIPKDATYPDLVDVVRGGALVDVWMKNSDRCASVSFVDPADAEAYFRYAKKNDIYIKGRRVDIKWREASRQFVILRNVSRQIQHDGASRILRLRNVPSSLTEERLREDLDHIANLRVERIVRLNGGSDIQCNLNSVCAALFARTCLRSRANYKVCKIEFGVDECAKPLPDFKEYKPPRQKTSPQQKQQRANRFDALFADDGGEENGDDSGDETVSVSTFTQDDDDTSVCESNWADSIAAESNTDGGADLGNYWG
ncbi:hypothetical protein K440DRAFT_369831 [Wilcoxina mikolae CBS 423.85]|nr:hypothetical protein K440DRAFT_369831 [Wilcoxina mikolae CBS 423.85]